MNTNLATPIKNTFFNKMVIFLVVWCAFQDLFLPLLLKITGSVGLVKVLFFSKDVLLIMLFAVAFIKTKGIKGSYVILTMTFMIIVFIYMIVGISAGIDSTSALSSFRGWILLPCLFYIGYALDNKNHFFKRTLPKIFKFYVFLAVLGILEYLLDVTVGTKSFWINTIGLSDYMSEIKGQEGRLVEGLPGNFYGSYGGGFLTTKRLCGVWASPLAAAYNFLLPIAYYFVAFLRSRKFKPLFFFAIVYVALVLTMTRAIILLSLPMLLLLAFYYLKPYRALIVIVTIVGGIAVFIAFKDKILGYIFDQSTSGHTESISNSLSSIKSIFGSGLGTYGVGTEIGTESAFISCLGQLGLFGLVLYVWTILTYIKADYFLFRKSRHPAVFAIFVATALLFLTGLISEQIIAYTSSVLSFILMGLIARPNVVKETDYGQNYHYQRVYR